MKTNTVASATVSHGSAEPLNSADAHARRRKRIYESLPMKQAVYAHAMADVHTAAVALVEAIDAAAALDADAYRPDGRPPGDDLLWDMLIDDLRCLRRYVARDADLIRGNAPLAVAHLIREEEEDDEEGVASPPADLDDSDDEDEEVDVLNLPPAARYLVYAEALASILCNLNVTVQHVDQAADLPAEGAPEKMKWKTIREQLGALRWTLSMHHTVLDSVAPGDVLHRVPRYKAESLTDRLAEELRALEEDDADADEDNVPAGRAALVAQVEALTRQVASLRELLDGDTADVPLELVVE